MIGVIFICHGNICRSPMAEFLFLDVLKKRGLSDQFFVASAATSTEEISSPVYPKAKKKLNSLGISCDGKRSQQVKLSDYDTYDYLLVMEKYNLKNLERIIPKHHDTENKIHKLLDFTESKGDIADPWYTGDFDTTHDDIMRGIDGFLSFVLRKDN
ncbi:MAG: low molecular weight protein-tyrosine-phosphatase [Bacillota bacterium]